MNVKNKRIKTVHWSDTDWRKDIGGLHYISAACGRIFYEMEARETPSPITCKTCLKVKHG